MVNICCTWWIGFYCSALYETPKILWGKLGNVLSNTRQTVHYQKCHQCNPIPDPPSNPPTPKKGKWKSYKQISISGNTTFITTELYFTCTKGYEASQSKLWAVLISNIVVFCSGWLIDWLIDWLSEWVSEWVIDWLADWYLLHFHLKNQFKTLSEENTWPTSKKSAD